MLYDAFYFCYSFLLDRIWIFAAIAAWYVLCFCFDLLFDPYGKQNRQILRAKKNYRISLAIPCPKPYRCRKRTHNSPPL